MRGPARLLGGGVLGRRLVARGCGVGPGQQTLGSGGDKLPYAPLPAGLAAKGQAQLSKMTCNGSPIS